MQPDLSVNEDVNDGYRTGVRAAVRFEPNDRLTITPRLVYQKVEMDGWNRIDDFNILANPLHHHAAGGDARRARAVHPARGAVHRRLPARRPEPRATTSASMRAHLDHLVHRPRRPRRPRRDRADGQHHRRHHRPAGDVYTLDAPLFDATKAEAWTQELRLSHGRGASRWVAGVFYSHQNATTARTCR